MKIDNLTEFKKTKHHSIYLMILRDAIYPSGYNLNNKNIKIKTEKYSCCINYNPLSISGIVMYTTINRPDSNLTREIKITQEIYDYLVSLYYSEEFAFGKWLKSSDLDWDKIEGI
jgi:hypothetical protein